MAGGVFFWPDRDNPFIRFPGDFPPPQQGIADLALGGVDFSELAIVLQEAVTNDVNEVAEALRQIHYGGFIQTVIGFLISAFVFFMIVRTYNRMTAKREPEPAPHPGPSEKYLLKEIRDLLVKNQLDATSILPRRAARISFPAALSLILGLQFKTMADQTLRLHDLTFQPYLSAGRIQQRVRELGAAIRTDYADCRPAFLVLLKGAFIFAADLIRACDLRAEVCFVRLASYQGTASSGTVDVHLPPDPAEIAGRDLIIVEDIVDSGNTLTHFLPEISALQPASIRIATLLFKPAALQHELQLDYVGFEIPDRFVVGYGLDYDGLGRSLPAIYEPVP